MLPDVRTVAGGTVAAPAHGTGIRLLAAPAARRDPTWDAQSLPLSIRADSRLL